MPRCTLGNADLSESLSLVCRDLTAQLCIEDSSKGFALSLQEQLIPNTSSVVKAPPHTLPAAVGHVRKAPHSQLPYKLSIRDLSSLYFLWLIAFQRSYR